jgi:aspartate aminotransferase
MTVSTFKRASRIAAIELSEIVQIQEAAQKKRAEGHDVVALGTGEPDFGTPEHVKDAAIAAMRAEDTKYPKTAGNPPLREAIVEKFRRDNGLELDVSNVIASTGAKQVIFNALMATLEEGDEVIMPAPYWTSYSDMVTVCGGVPIVIPCGQDSGFKLSAERLEAAITDKTKWLMLNTPSNPSGAVYDVDEMQALGEVLDRHPHVWLMSDEIYEHLVYASNGFQSAWSILPQLNDRTLIINGVSKSYAMTGWRLGFGVGPTELISAMVVIQGNSTSGASSISQAAAVGALNGPQDLLAERRTSFEERRDMVVEGVNVCEGLNCVSPPGAFYVFPSCEGVIGKKTPDGQVLKDDADFCRYLLDSQALALVPGRAFGVPGYFRISYAYAKTDLEKAMVRLKAGCEVLV